MWKEDEEVDISDEEIALLARRVAKIRDTHNLALRGVKKLLGRGVQTHLQRLMSFRSSSKMLTRRWRKKFEKNITARLFQ